MREEFCLRRMKRHVAVIGFALDGVCQRELAERLGTKYPAFVTFDCAACESENLEGVKLVA